MFTRNPPAGRTRVLEAALQLFAEQGFAATTMRQIAERAGTSLGLTYRYFPAKESLALALYERLALELAEQVPSLPAGTVAERFRAAMALKLGLLEPHRGALLALFARALNPDDPLGVLAHHTAHVRSRVSGVFAVVVLGATDAPSGAEARRWARMLYGLHLALTFVWTQDRSHERQATRDALALMADALAAAPALFQFLPVADAALDRVDGILGHLLQTAADAPPEARVEMVLDSLLAGRRLAAGEPETPSDAARALHRPSVEEAVRTGSPLHLVLPAFPAKAPNPHKTLGPLPDLAETLALEHLDDFCARLEALHPEGVALTICSDGHVFADVVEVPDHDVSRYRAALKARLPERFTTFDLMDVYGTLSAEDARERLLSEWAMSLDALRAEAERNPQTQRLVDGMHRFLMEDLVQREPSQSRTQARKRTRAKAWEMVRRSRAWGDLVGSAFPEAIRLSIHPQPDVSSKIGVHLLPVRDVWLTPWHGVAVLDAQGVRLERRADVPEDAVLRETDGRPTHFEVLR